MSSYWSRIVRDLVPYTPGEQPRLARLIKLNTNENPYPPAPGVVDAICAELGAKGDSLRRYPDPEGGVLKAAIAHHYRQFGIAREQVFLGNGSDEVLAHVFCALLQHGRPLLFPDITYSFYPVYCKLYGIAFERVPLADDFSLRIDDYLERDSAQIGGVIFPNPNAPTGRALALDAIRALLRAHPRRMLVIDEAYVDFGAQSALSLVREHPNLLVTQTFSKSRSLAGLRVGFAIGQPELIVGLERVKNSFNSYPLDRLAQAGAIAALADDAYFERTRAAVMQSREELAQRLAALGFEVIPSAANFLFVRHPGFDAAQLARHLREVHIIVRHFRQPRISDYLRISIGTPEECAALVAALQYLLTPSANRKEPAP
ncbi:MAG: histidinol-phosphate transaminase [Zoogloeaceae bacterium]|jgi:histidinol-phosphate aminotransferase|nr:histidinol-phosphate transaminase [Zoogloeaceae bacterium]